MAILSILLPGFAVFVLSKAKFKKSNVIMSVGLSGQIVKVKDSLFPYPVPPWRPVSNRVPEQVEIVPSAIEKSCANKCVGRRNNINTVYMCFMDYIVDNL